MWSKKSKRKKAKVTRSAKLKLKRKSMERIEFNNQRSQFCFVKEQFYSFQMIHYYIFKWWNSCWGMYFFAQNPTKEFRLILIFYWFFGSFRYLTRFLLRHSFTHVNLFSAPIPPLTIFIHMLQQSYIFRQSQCFTYLFRLLFFKTIFQIQLK